MAATYIFDPATNARVDQRRERDAADVAKHVAHLCQQAKAALSARVLRDAQKQRLGRLDLLRLAHLVKRLAIKRRWRRATARRRRRRCARRRRRAVLHPVLAVALLHHKAAAVGEKDGWLGAKRVGQWLQQNSGHK